MQSAILDRSKISTFLLSGNAIATVANVKSGNRFTYRVRQCKNDAALAFVQVLSGPDNTSDYAYLGTIRAGQYAHGTKSRISDDAPSAKAFAWLWEHKTALPACVEVYHEGRCGRCGRVLTVPESVMSGYGPECINKITVAA